MREQDILGIMEAYGQVYNHLEVLQEGPFDAENVRRAQQAQQGRDAFRNIGGYAGLAQAARASALQAANSAANRQQDIDDYRRAFGKKPESEKQGPPVPSRLTNPAGNAGGSGSGSSGGNPTRPAGSTPPRPAARPAGPVLSKKNGVEGTGVGANFKPRAFTAAEKSRYANVAAQNAPKSSTTTPAASAPKPAIGKLGNTSFERRTPTSAELRAAQGARVSGASPEKALQAAQRTNLPTQGPTPAIPSASDVASAVAKANSPAVINRPAPAGSALAKQQAQQKSKPPTPGTMTQSYEWPSAKTIRDIADAYASIYEAKKEKQNPWWDDDGDGIGYEEGEVSSKFKKKKKKVKEEVEIDEATAMAKRGYDETKLRQRAGGGEAADRATALENRPTYGNKNKEAQRSKYARAQRGDFRNTASSNPGLHGYGFRSNDPEVKAKQAARGAQRGALTPREKKELNREAYEVYEIVSSYLLENNFAETLNDANVIIENMSENWILDILEEKKPLPVSKMKKKESKLLDNEEGQLQALRTDVGSPERKARMKELQRFDNINSVRTSFAKRGGKQQHSMPEIGRYKPKDED